MPIEQDFGLGETNQEIQFKHTTDHQFDWLQIVLNAMPKEKRISKRSLDELFDEIKIAFGCINRSTASCKSEITQKSMDHGESDSFHVKSFSGFTKAVQRIIKLVEGIAPKSFICNNGPDCLEENRHSISDLSPSPKSKDYFIHVFQWKVPISDFENFAEEVAFALDWSINNCANSTNASTSRDKIKKHFNSFLSVSENENQIDVDDRQSLGTPSVAYSDDKSGENNQHDFLEEIRK